MTDAMHIPALSLLSRTLQLLFGMLVSGEIEVTLLPSCATSFQNVLEVEKAVAEYLKERFPRCSEGIIDDYVILMGKNTAKSNAEYLVINRDFLIQLKVGEEEGSEEKEVTNVQVNLFADVEEEEKRRKEAADLERRRAIPGLIGANEATTEYDQIANL